MEKKINNKERSKKKIEKIKNLKINMDNNGLNYELVHIILTKNTNFALVLRLKCI